jgi:protein-glutamine gamma-glutamyltransferase
MVGVKPVLQIMAYVTACIGLMPVLPFLDLWIQVTLAGGLMLGFIGERRNHSILSDRLSTLLSIGFFVLFINQASFVNLVTPLINLLCLLLAVRLAGDKSGRHLLQIFLLATIILASSSMLTLDMVYLIYLILIILMVTSGLVLLSFYTTAPEISFTRKQWTRLVKTIVLLPIGSLLLMIVLFFILPRTQTPLWNFLNPRPAASAGMTDQVSPGSVAELATSGKTAFRAEMKRLPADSLYWRGIVLDKLQGNTWTRSNYAAKEELIPDPDSEVQINLYAEPKTDNYLISLDRALKIEGINHRLTPDGVASGRIRNNRKIRYQMQVQFKARSKQLGEVSHYLKRPSTVSERLKQVAEEIGQKQDFHAKRETLDRFFLQQQLSYSAEKLPDTKTPVETFLFESRRGYCEYFASSYALLLRLAGVPTRLVGGYLGGEFNQLGHYYLVKEDAAHVWIEALDDQGIWQRIDPSSLAVNANEAFARSSTTILANFQAFTDAIGHLWSQMVLNYDLHQQFNLLRNLVRKTRNLKQPESWALKEFWWALIPVLFGGSYYLLRRRKNRIERLLHRYRSLIAIAAGEELLPESTGLYTIADSCNHPLCRQFADIYGAAIYHDKPLANKDLQALTKIVRHLKRQQATLAVKLPKQDVPSSDVK